VITLLYQVAALVLRYMLGQNAPGGAIFAGLVPTMLLNLILDVPRLRARAPAAASARMGAARGAPPWLSVSSRAASCRRIRTSRSRTG
jgi:hypothetical protein